MNEFKPFELAKRIENRILIGIAAVTASIIVVGWIAINENARMQEFTERSHARSIEAGARLFETNCSTCHGVDALGLPGVAPALNNPQLFGYNYFKDIDAELQLVAAQLAKEGDPARLAELQARQAQLEAERLDLEEKILYDWSDKIAELDQQLADLDAQIEQLEGVDNASRLPVYISQREANELAPLLAERDDLKAKSDAAVAEAAAQAVPATGVETTPSAETTPTAESTPAPTAEATEAAAPALPGLTDEENARYAELEAQIAAIEETLKPYRDLADQRAALVAQRGRFQAVMDAQAEVVARRAELADYQAQLAALGDPPAEGEDPNAAQRAELIVKANEARTAQENAEVTRKKAYDTLVSEKDILDYDPNEPGRLARLGWTGGMFDFLESTLISGRPTSAAYWPQPMVAWGQASGGPLRGDQIVNLVNYIMNFDREFTIADIRAVRQFAKIPADPATASFVTGEPIGTDNLALINEEIAAQTADGTITAGDPVAGETTFTNYGCSGCHGQQNGTGPAVVGIWTRTQNDQDGRLSQTGFEDDPQAYLIQSIVNPNAYVVPGFNAGIMPQNFAERVSYQDLVNILAYLQTHNE